MQNTTKTNNVFLNAEGAAIVVTVNNVVVGAAYTAEQLVALFAQNNVCVLKDTIMCSSSIDFAAEEGFDTDDCAHNIIDEAFEALS